MKKILLVAIFIVASVLYSYNASSLYTSPAQIMVNAGSTATTTTSPSSSPGSSNSSSSNSSGSSSSSSTSSSSSDISYYDFLMTDETIEDADGQTITAQGTYVMNSEIGFSGASGTCAITVNSSHVTIDLNNRVLSYTGNATSNVHGICIASGKKNIIIKNGTIAGFPGYGISAIGTSENTIQELKVENVSLVNNQSGFVGTYINGGRIKHCDANNNRKNAGTVYGISLAYSNAIQIHATNAHTNSTLSGTCYGIVLSGCTASSIIQSHTQFNQGESAAGISISDSNSKNNIISHCISNNNNATTGNSYGIILQASYPTVYACRSNNNHSNSGTSYGIGLFSTSHAHIEDNIVSQHTHGIYDNEALASQTNLFIHNTAYQNGTNFYKVYGPPISSIFVNANHLQDALQAGEKDNISISYT